MASASAELKPDWYEPLLPFVPDFIVRKGVVSQLEGRLKDISAQGNWEEQIARKTAFVQQLKQMDIAIHTKDANEQHYEVPSEFYTMVLGKNLKYSCCLYTSPTMTLDEAEDAMLATYVTKAQLVDGQDVLDLGCGWGSLSLYLAAKFPNSRITGLSNSATQREYIMATAQKRGLKNVNIVTGDIRVFDSFPAGSFDRVCSIEMFEHMKNYEKLLEKISRWLRTEGKLFVHIFCHKHYPYHYETAGENNWMARHFFTGGTMPSADLLVWFQRDLVIVNQWAVNGEHYARTSEDWLKRLDNNPAAVRKIFAQTYGEANADKWVMMWRLFFLAVAEMFRYGGGNEWGVAHYLFEKRAPKP